VPFVAAGGEGSGVGKTMAVVCVCRYEGGGGCTTDIDGVEAVLANGTLNPLCFSGKVWDGVRTEYVVKDRRMPSAGGREEIWDDEGLESEGC